MKYIQLVQFSPEEFKALIKDGYREQLEDFKTQWSKKELENEILTREETCSFLDIDASTLARWTKKGKIQSFGISGRRYYKKSQIMASLKEVKD